jgi:hypothetical protein
MKRLMCGSVRCLARQYCLPLSANLYERAKYPGEVFYRPEPNVEQPQSARHISNHGTDRNLEGVSTVKFLWSLTALAVFYAGIHAYPWNVHFLISEEAITWKVAICYIGASGFIASMGYYIHEKIQYIRVQVLKDFGAGFFWFLLVVLVLCMCYLVVESFISLRSLPIGSYSTASWVNFLPHIG